MEYATNIDDKETIVDPTIYRNALGSFASGVTVLTTKASESPVGTTVSAFSALSLVPPLVLVSLALKSETLAHIKRAGFFSVNILSAGQGSIARRFATSNGSTKFDGVEYSLGKNGAPLFAGISASLECDLDDCFRGGDHDILIGFVRAARVSPELAPLVYYRGGFVGLGEADK
ncbi:MAG: flavin reductase family protein [Parvibaculum sp.]|nr:flavin reductase family protein [Parvibaculum sp.]